MKVFQDIDKNGCLLYYEFVQRYQTCQFKEEETSVSII